MGLMKAFSGAVRSELADQWKEYFYCDSMGTDVLIRKGIKKTGTTNFKSSNTKASDNVISEGSMIAVNEGQAMVVVEDGKIVDFTCEPGGYSYDFKTEPSLFSGSFGKSLVKTFQEVGKRFVFGGDTGKDQRIYYVNLKEIIGNKFGSAQPMPYDDPYYKSVLYVRYFGIYSFKVTDPLRLYTAVAGNVSGEYRTSQLQEQSDTEFYSALDTAMSKLALDGVKFSMLPSKQMELANYMNEVLDESWRQLRGLEIVSVGINKITPDNKSRERIEQFDNATMLGGNQAAMQGRMVAAQATAFENMGKQSAGTNGLDMMGMAFGVQAMNQMGQMMQQQQVPQAAAQAAQQPEPAKKETEGWTCACGAENQGKFCSECGMEKPKSEKEWLCACGMKNTGKFCSECGKPRPAEGWTCACGAENQGNFCSECGSPRPEA